MTLTVLACGEELCETSNDDLLQHQSPYELFVLTFKR